ncbi:MAG: hypothetical protein AAFY72_08865, partial [Cyanobacteria bacterium J06649_4]
APPAEGQLADLSSLLPIFPPPEGWPERSGGRGGSRDLGYQPTSHACVYTGSVGGDARRAGVGK